jgi:5-methylcytosine-specific restriction endonuclease McrA
MTPSPIQACPPCRAHTSHLCACGCGRYRRKYDIEGRIRLYISGHNDVWANHRRQSIACVVCQKPFRPNTWRQRLCSIACRTAWLTLNPPNEKKRVLVECAVCGTQMARKLSDVQTGRDAACSPRCRYILVANKLRGRNLSLPKRLALRRDKARCRICGFDTMVEVHHIIARRHSGPDTLDNLITLCPNHHTMADRGLIPVEELRALLTEHTFTGRAKMTG